MSAASEAGTVPEFGDRRRCDRRPVDGPVPEIVSGGGEMADLIRATDWAKTPVGPAEAWSPALRTIVGVLLANRAPLLLWWGPDYISIYNDAYRPVLGTKHPWALGKPFRECWAEIRHVLEPLIDTPFHGGPATWMDDIQLEINRYGFLEETHFTIAYSPVPDDTTEGGIGGVLAIVHEITEKIVGERRLAALRDLGARTGEARTATEACAIAAETLGRHAEDIPFALLYLIDPDGKYARLAGASGIGADKVASTAVVEFAAEARPAEGWPLAAASRDGAMVTVDDLAARFAEVPRGPWPDPPETAVIVPVRSTKVDQLAGWLIAGVSPRLRLDEPYLSFLALVAAQIATAVATARAYEEERKKAEALAEIDRAKTAFFANISHEFRTPLTLMLGPVEDVLASGELRPLERERLDLAHRNALRLLKLVNSLLDFSRIEAGRARAHYEATDLAALTVELASNFRSACERAGLRLVVDCPPLGVPAYVDRDMWEKIVLNLLSNAFKFTFEGGIAVWLGAVNGRAVLSVGDSGVGIGAQELPHLFERFHRIEGQKSRTYEGSGIGLALVQELVKLHGGTIAVESKPGFGTTFTISIPFGTAHLPKEQIGTAEKPAATSVRAQAYVEEALRWLPDGGAAGAQAGEDAGLLSALRWGVRVLVADDNADMRDYVRRLLQGHCEVETVGDGLAALEAMRARRPDLVISDAMMPRLDGVGLVRGVRADPHLGDIPVIMLSARAGEESRIEGLTAGADDYLVKPFAARELIARVEASLKLARARAEAARELHDSEMRYRTLFETMDTGCAIIEFIRDGIGTAIDFRHVEVNPAIERAIGRGAKDLVGRTISEVLPPEDARFWIEAYDQVALSGVSAHVERFVEPLQRWLSVTVTPYGRGRVAAFCENITERKRAEAVLRRSEEHLRLLVGELNHRVKNTLATVQSLALQSLRGASSLAAGRAAFEARLIALSKAHDVLVREHWEGAELHEVVAAALAAYFESGAESRLTVRGPKIRLQPTAALALSMALHELATNAIKHGALSNAKGRIAVIWQVLPSDAGGEFSLRWVESGGPPVVPPRRRGFGSRLIERGLAQDLHGEVALEFKSEGVVCTVRAPLHEIRVNSDGRAT